VTGNRCPPVSVWASVGVVGRSIDIGAEPGCRQLVSMQQVLWHQSTRGYESTTDDQQRQAGGRLNHPAQATHQHTRDAEMSRQPAIQKPTFHDGRRRPVRQQVRRDQKPYSTQTIDHTHIAGCPVRVFSGPLRSSAVAHPQSS